MSGPVASWVADAPAIQQTFVEKIRALRGPFDKVSEITEQIKDAAVPADKPQVQEVVVKEGSLPALLWLAGYPATYIIILSGAVVLPLFLMASGNLIYEKILRLMPTLTDKKMPSASSSTSSATSPDTFFHSLPLMPAWELWWPLVFIFSASRRPTCGPLSSSS